MAASKLFLSYRRDDAGAQTGRLYDHLNAAFPGRVFRDLSGIEVGVNFAQQIKDAIASSAVLIAVIGRQWASITDEHGERRILQPKDFVRLEICEALQKQLRIYPILVDGAKMPSESDLPPDIRALAGLQAMEIPEVAYDYLVKELISKLEKVIGATIKPDDERAQVDALVRRAEGSIALEDWMDAIQKLQAALSLDQANSNIAGRLRFAQDQMRLAGLYADGLRRYQSMDKAGALDRFRQLRSEAGSYKNVDQMIALIQSEGRVPGPPALPAAPRKSKWKLWAGLAAGALLVLGAIGNLMDKSDQTKYNPRPAPATYVDNPQPVRQAAVQPATQADDAIEDFEASGAWDMRSEANPNMGMLITFAPDGTFSTQSQMGAYQYPASSGYYQYNSASRQLIMTGVNNMGASFREVTLITNKHGDHIHAMYAGTQWALRRR